MTAATTLRTVPLFAQLREGDLPLLSRVLRVRDYPKNSVILFADEPCETFYVLLSGQVKVTLIAEDGREVILSLFQSGDFFGEMALVDDEPQSATVIATEDSRLLLLRRDDFRRCIEEMPPVAFGLLRALCTRLRDADQKIGGLILLDVPGRVARLLLELAEQDDGQYITDPPTHHVISQMIGSSRETVSRTIRSFAVQELIEVSRRRITIRNREALEIAAGRLPRARAQRRQQRRDDQPLTPPGAAAR